MADLTGAVAEGGEGRAKPTYQLRVNVVDLFKLLDSPASRRGPAPSPEAPSPSVFAAESQVVVSAPAQDQGHGLTIAEFAARARVDRRRVSRQLVEIPPGPVPPLPPGKVPCRLIGNTRRIFIVDFLGDPSSIGVRNASNHQEAPAGAVQAASSWARQVARFRRG